MEDSCKGPINLTKGIYLLETKKSETSEALVDDNISTGKYETIFEAVKLGKITQKAEEPL